jgi:hypothetical protein
MAPGTPGGAGAVSRGRQATVPERQADLAADRKMLLPGQRVSAGLKSVARATPVGRGHFRIIALLRSSRRRRLAGTVGNMECRVGSRSLSQPVGLAGFKSKAWGLKATYRRALRVVPRILCI